MNDSQEYKDKKAYFVKIITLYGRNVIIEVLQDDFKEKVISVYKEMLPFRRYLNKAITV